MKLARPRHVIVTADTERLVKTWFDCAPAGAPGSLEHDLLFEVHGERNERDRLDRLARPGP